jgi:hypothetical protein
MGRRRQQKMRRHARALKWWLRRRRMTQGWQVWEIGWLISGRLG